MQVTLALEDVYVGKQFDATIRRYEVCPHCGGAGAEPGVGEVQVGTCVAPPVVVALAVGSWWLPARSKS